MINSVLVAGTNTVDNLIVRYCQDLMLHCEHIGDLGTTQRIVPGSHDAAIIAVTAISHHTYKAVKECYQKQDKPVFLSSNGISNIREDFDVAVFGSPYILGKLREPMVEFIPGGGLPTVLPISTRFWWVISRFYKPGDEIKYKDVSRLFEKNIIKNHEGALSQCWQKARTTGFLEAISHGTCRFIGVPEYSQTVLTANKMPINEEYVMRQNTSSKVVIIKKQPYVQPEPELTMDEMLEEVTEKFDQVVDKLDGIIEPKPSHDSGATAATIELLLEAMSTQQEQIKDLKKFVESTIPTLIQGEIRGITMLLGGLVPKLQGLGPKEIEQVDKMVDLFLSAMRYQSDDGGVARKIP